MLGKCTLSVSQLRPEQTTGAGWRVRALDFPRVNVSNGLTFGIKDSVCPPSSP